MTAAAFTIVFGSIVGFCVGLTGGGGSIFAVPLLVYGVGLSAHRAVCASMVAVAVTAEMGAAQKMRTHEVEVRTALLLIVGGISGAPLGAWLGRFISGRSLLLLFGSVVMLVGLRMLMRTRNQHEAPGASQSLAATAHRRTIGLISAGVFSGLLSGLLGIGGGFVIVPTLVLFATMQIHRAIATSLLVMAVIGASAVTAHLIAGQNIPAGATILFAIGSIAGFSAGSVASNTLSAARLEKIFAVVMLLMATFLVARNLG